MYRSPANSFFNSVEKDRLWCILYNAKHTMYIMIFIHLHNGFVGVTYARLWIAIRILTYALHEVWFSHSQWGVLKNQFWFVELRIRASHDIDYLNSSYIQCLNISFLILFKFNSILIIFKNSKLLKFQNC